MTEKTYNQIEALLKAKRIQEEPEDILLELAEHLADTGQTDTPLTHKLKIGKTTITATGICTPSDEDPEEISVLIKALTIDGDEFPIDEYLL